MLSHLCLHFLEMACYGAEIRPQSLILQSTRIVLERWNLLTWFWVVYTGHGRNYSRLRKCDQGSHDYYSLQKGVNHSVKQTVDTS